MNKNYVDLAVVGTCAYLVGYVIGFNECKTKAIKIVLYALKNHQENKSE